MVIKMEIKPSKIFGVLLTIFLLGSSLFIVEEKKQAIVVQFGEAVRTISDAGLHFKIPFIQNVLLFDKMLLDVNVSDKEVLAKDQKRIIINAYAKYKIVDSLKYFQTVKTSASAKNRLVSDLESSLRQVIGEEPLTSLLTEQRAKIMHKIKDITDDKAKKAGIEIIDVKIKRADLPKENSNSIYSRMQTDREKEAKEFRAQGFEEAQKIKSEAEKESREIIASAKKTGEITMGEGDAEGNKIFIGVANLDPDFYDFYRSMQVYRKVMQSSNTTMILSQDSDFLKYFK